MPRLNNAAGTGEVAAPGRDDRSGLLDIRALSSVVDARDERIVASASSVALPSFNSAFNSAWTVFDLRSPATEPASPRAPALARPGGERLLYAMIAALSATVVSLGAFVVMRPPPRRVEVAVETAAERVRSSAGPQEAVAPGSGERPAAPPDALEEPPQEAVAVAAARAPVVEPGSSGSSGSSASSSRGRRARPPRTRTRRAREPARAPVSAAAEPPKTADSGVLPIECVIDPKSCRTSGRRRAPESVSASTPKARPARGTRPATPSSAEIRAAMGKRKLEARACRSRHGGRAGDKVRVKLSAAGATGRIVSARALDEHAGTPLGRCVAEALSSATLPQFSKERAGIVYALRL